MNIPGMSGSGKPKALPVIFREILCLRAARVQIPSPALMLGLHAIWGLKCMKKVSALTAYFSRTGNTAAIAQQIHEDVGGNIFEIVPVDAYPSDYDEATKQARKELDSDYRPKLKTKVENMKSYDVVFVGYPMWWGTMPRPVAAFLSEYEFSGKTIVPFCTHEGSRLGRSVEDIKGICPKSTVLDGLAVRGGDAKKAQKEVTKWMRELGMKA